MLVFENLVETSNLGTLEAGAVVPSNLIVNALLPIDVSRTLLRNIGIAIANPNSGPANVTMTLNNSDGTQRTSTTLTIATRQQIAKLVTELFLVGSSSTQSLVPAEFTGTLVIAAAIPVSIVGARLRGSDFSILPPTDRSPGNNPVPAIISGVGGLGAVVLTQFVTGGGWTTETEIVNTTANNLTVRMDVFAPDGSPLTVTLNGITGSSFTNLTVPVNGILKIAP
jgi:hypothetical protein